MAMREVPAASSSNRRIGLNRIIPKPESKILLRSATSRPYGRSNAKSPYYDLNLNRLSRANVATMRHGFDSPIFFAHQGRIRSSPFADAKTGLIRHLRKQSSNNLTAVGDLHGATVLASERRFERNTQRLTDRRHDILRGVWFGFNLRSIFVC